ncbi:MAG: hypothetical protein HDQ87_01800 [Clostridia bacterium]|nr:hypothetical protein [Clostridia bacterium]
MEQEYNIGDLWQWARSGVPAPFTLRKNGEPACQVIRVNGDGMDWLYAQYEPDNGTFSVPFEPFGMWGWPERMCCVRDEYAGLGNWNLADAEQRLRDAYRAAVSAEVQKVADQLIEDGYSASKEDEQAAQKLADKLAERGITPENWAAADLIKVSVPQYYPGALFLDEGRENERVLSMIQADDEKIQAAARTVAALLAPKDAAASKPAAAKTAKLKSAGKPGRSAVKEEPPTEPAAPEDSPAAENEKNERAREAILQALDGLRVHKLKMKLVGQPRELVAGRVDIVKDLKEIGTIRQDRFALTDFTEPIPAMDVEKITKVSSPKGGSPAVIYERED